MELKQVELQFTNPGLILRYHIPFQFYDANCVFYKHVKV